MCYGQKKDVAFGFTDQHLSPGGHLCYIYTDEEEHCRTMGQFVESGLASGEKVAYLADAPSGDELERYLSSLGVNLPEDLLPGQLVVSEAETTYCPDGAFLPERMIETWHSMYRQSINEGFSGVRVTGETGWTCNAHPGMERWFEYESMLNVIVNDVPFSSIICQYDANRLGGANLYEVLRVHPLMIVRGQILHNPYYEAPEQYLSRLRASA
ncbi:MEDS domain-containing protein [Methylocaldum sp.]|uniref:MEDS domain-containing protein n=1 Tax=Methylocaldum sp. TaxID=1969727 RepID=UPI002D42B3EB|nr:MEDS domain-containing protein [Methylocaldum sp.]HYE36699.1 MEDS domain-containing protein [Methylocaldum sp.]